MTNFNKRICVIGLGYIGLPTASLLGTKGYKVHGVDTSEHVVDTINKGRIHIVEPDLDILVKSAVHSGNLTAGLKPQAADVFILAVPTPFKDNHQPDLSYVESKIFNGVEEVLLNPVVYEAMAFAHNPYGDGKAVSRLLKVLRTL